jgi:hypothetical protein
MVKIGRTVAILARFSVGYKKGRPYGAGLVAGTLIMTQINARRRFFY